MKVPNEGRDISTPANMGSAIAFDATVLGRSGRVNGQKWMDPAPVHDLTRPINAGKACRDGLPPHSGRPISRITDTSGRSVPVARGAVRRCQIQLLLDKATTFVLFMFL